MLTAQADGLGGIQTAGDQLVWQFFATGIFELGQGPGDFVAAL